MNELVSESLAAGHSHLSFASSFELENDGVTVFNLYNFQDFSKPDKNNMKIRKYLYKLFLGYNNSMGSYYMPLESVNNGFLVVCFKAGNLEFGRTSVNAGSKGSG